MAVTTKLTIRLEADETYPHDLATTSKPHVWPTSLTMPQVRGTGTASNTQDSVWTDTRTPAASADTLDLRGVLTNAEGTAIQFAEVTGFGIANLSESTGEVLTIGAGSNPFITWLKATGDGVVLGPGGIFYISSPLDGYATTNSSADILTIDPGSDTISYEIIIIGRSS